MYDLVSDLLEIFNGYRIYDEEDQSYHERRDAERQLGNGRGYSLSADLIETWHLKRDAENIGKEIEAQKLHYRLMKELMELELDYRRRSARVADKKRKRVSDLSRYIF